MKFTLNTWIVLAILLGVAFGFLVRTSPGDLELKPATIIDSEEGGRVEDADGRGLDGILTAIGELTVSRPHLVFLDESAFTHTPVKDLNGDGDSDDSFGIVVLYHEHVGRFISTFVDTNGDGRLGDVVKYIDDERGRSFTLDRDGGGKDQPLLSIVTHDDKMRLAVTVDDGLPTGILAGNESAWAGFLRQIVGFFRDFFLKLLKMIIVPIIFFSIVSGVLSIGEGGGLGRIGFKTISYYLTTSLLAIVTGLVLVNVIAPGEGASFGFSEVPKGLESAQKGISEFLFDFLLNLIPANPVQAMVAPNVLQIIVFALLFGLCITRIPDPYRETLTRFFTGCFQVMMKVVQLVILFAPIGIFALIARVIAEVGFEAFGNLGLYALCVFGGLAIHACVTLPLLLFFVAKVSPKRHFLAMSKALLTAFSTSSSSATLPLTLECVQERSRVSNKVSSFVLPLGATVNMDGTALYECVAAVFIAQVYMTMGEVPPLTFGQQFLVVVTALAASIGAAGVPMAGMVMISIILTAIGLPLEGIGIILAVDRILDMCRTTVNVWSDSCGAVVVARLEGEKQVLAGT